MFESSVGQAEICSSTTSDSRTCIGLAIPFPGEILVFQCLSMISYNNLTIILQYVYLSIYKYYVFIFSVCVSILSIPPIHTAFTAFTAFAAASITFQRPGPWMTVTGWLRFRSEVLVSHGVTQMHAFANKIFAQS